MRGVKTKANILKIYERNEKDTGGKALTDDDIKPWPEDNASLRVMILRPMYHKRRQPLN